jgi:hypothetical protein
MRDGVKLMTKIYLPRDKTAADPANPKFPAIVDRSPYGYGNSELSLHFFNALIFRFHIYPFVFFRKEETFKLCVYSFFSLSLSFRRYGMDHRHLLAIRLRGDRTGHAWH